MVTRIWLVLAVATAASAAPPPRFGEPTALTFDDGLRVVLQSTPDSPTVSVVARVTRGYHDDPEQARGTAHLIEHLWFRALNDDTDVWTTLQQRGCTTTATTGPSETNYVATCPAAEAELLAQLFVDGLRDPTRGVDDATTAVEIAVIDQESRERSDGNRDVFQALYRSLLPEDHAAHVTFETPDWSLRALSLAGARGWVAQNYTPENTLLAMAGTFDQEAVRGIIEAAHGPASPLVAAADADAGGPRQGPAPARSTDTVQLTQERPLSSLMLGWNLPPELNFSTGMRIAASHMGSELDQALIDDDSVIDASCFVQPHPDAPAMICTVTLDSGAVNDPELHRVIDDALGEAWSRKDRKSMRERLLRVRAEAPQDLLFGHSEPLARAHRFIVQLAADRQPSPIEQSIADVKRWKPGGAAAVAERWFTPERAARLFVAAGGGPDAAAPGDGSTTTALPAPVPPPSAAVLDGTDVSLPGVQVSRVDLPSGLVVLGVHRPASPYVMATIHLPGGSGAGPPGLTTLAETLSTGPRRAEAWGVRSGQRTHRDRVELWTIAPERQLFRSVDALLSEVSLRFPLVDADKERDENLDRHVRRLKSAMEGERRLTSWLVERSLSQAITPDHAPSRGFDAGELEAIRSIDGSTLLAYLWRTYQPTQATLVVTGPQPADEIAQLAARRFRRFRLRQGIPPEPYPQGPPAAAPSRLRATVDDPGRGYASILWRCRLPDPGTDAQRQVLDRLLADSLWSRLRHQRGLTYTPQSSISYWPDGTAQLDVAIDTVPDRVGTSLTELTDTLAALAAAPADGLPAAVARAQRGLATRADSLEGIEALVYQAHKGGSDLADPLGWHREQLGAVTPADIGATLSSCLDNAAWVVRGPATNVEPSLRAAGHTFQTLDVP